MNVTRSTLQLPITAIEGVLSVVAMVLIDSVGRVRASGVRGRTSPGVRADRLSRDSKKYRSPLYKSTFYVG